MLACKGAVAGAAYYGDPGLRPFNDADLLVPVRQARRAWDLLLSLGYAPTARLSNGALMASPVVLYDPQVARRVGL